MRSEPPRSRNRPPSGTVVEGPGFYVWDEDARTAELWGRALAGAAPAGSRGRRPLLTRTRKGRGRLASVRGSPPEEGEESDF